MYIFKFRKASRVKGTKPDEHRIKKDNIEVFVKVTSDDNPEPQMKVHNVVFIEPQICGDKYLPVIKGVNYRKILN